MNPAAPNTAVWRSCLAVMVLALIVRAYLCTQPACISRDGVHFVTYAKQLADDPIRSMQATTKQPGFAWLLLAVQRSVGPMLDGDEPLVWQRCGQLIALVGGVTACGLIFLLTRRLFDASTATVAGVLAAFWWQSAMLSADVLSDMPHLAVYLGALLIGYRGLADGRIRMLAICGAVAGLAYLMRQEALGIVAAVGVCRMWPARGVSRRKRLLGVVVLGVCFAAVVAPHAVAVGQVMPNKGLDDLVHHRMQVSAALHGGGNPVWVLAHVIPWWQTPGRLAEAWAKSGRYAVATLVLIALFLKSAPRAETGGRRLLLVAAGLQILLVQARVTAYGEISSRYSVILLALSIPWAATGLITLLTLLIGRLQPISLAGITAVCAIGIAAPLAPQVYYLLRPANAHRRSFRDAGFWLQAKTRPEDRILAHGRLEQMMFYAGRTWPDQTWIPFPPSDPLETIRGHVGRFDPAWYIDAEGSRREHGDESAHFRSLQDGTIPRLEHVQTIGRIGRRVFVFRVTEQAASGEPGA